MVDESEVFQTASRCVLAFTGRRGPVIAPMAFWFDGAGIWLSTPAVSVKAKALRSRPDCAVYVPAPDGAGGAVATGRARVYGLHDPLGLATHGPVVSAAMAALAARNTGTILGYVQDARSVPARFRPRNRVALRVQLDGLRPVAAPASTPGVAPALPLVVAPAVRRALAGQRTVVLATSKPGGGVRVGPASWGPGFAMTLPEGETVEDGPAMVHLGADPGSRPTTVIGLSLAGELSSRRLQPHRATWWEGFSLTTVDLPPTTPTLTLPD